MRCREVQAKLTERINDGQARYPADEVKTHLAGCARCRSLAVLERALLATARTGFVPPPPDGFADGVLAAWQRETAFGETPHPALQPFAIAWAALLRAYRDTAAALAISFEFTGRAALSALNGT